LVYLGYITKVGGLNEKVSGFNNWRLLHACLQ